VHRHAYRLKKTTFLRYTYRLKCDGSLGPWGGSILMCALQMQCRALCEAGVRQGAYTGEICGCRAHEGVFLTGFFKKAHIMAGLLFAKKFPKAVARSVCGASTLAYAHALCTERACRLRVLAIKSRRACVCVAQAVFAKLFTWAIGVCAA
jgi:hypothetical protein